MHAVRAPALPELGSTKISSAKISPLQLLKCRLMPASTGSDIGVNAVDAWLVKCAERLRQSLEQVLTRKHHLVMICAETARDL